MKLQTDTDTDTYIIEIIPIPIPIPIIGIGIGIGYIGIADYRSNPMVQAKCKHILDVLGRCQVNIVTTIFELQGKHNDHKKPKSV